MKEKKKINYYFTKKILHLLKIKNKRIIKIIIIKYGKYETINFLFYIIYLYFTNLIIFYLFITFRVWPLSVFI